MEYKKHEGFSNHLFQYARGFLLTYGSPKRVPKTWLRIEAHGWILSYDPRTPMHAYSNGDTLIVILGHALLVGDKTVSADVARIICNSVTEGTSQEYIDLLCGRFAVFQFGESVRIQQDAAGLRAVFYSRDSEVAGSHPALVAEQLNSSKGDFSRDSLIDMKLGCMPGHATEYEGILAQTPNTELNVNEGRVRRIYYGDLSQVRDVEEVSRNLIRLVDKQIPWLSTLHPVISLSAGLDSRTSLALLRPMLDSLKGFTYTSARLRKNANASHDLETAKQIANLAGIDFEILDMDEYEPDREVKDSLQSNFYRSHGAKLAGIYVDALSNQMNIRSNAFGIGRATYERVNAETTDSKGMARLAYGQNPNRNNPKVLEAFTAYARDTDFPVHADVSFKDLFFWEHRIGVWQSAIYIEADLSHYSHVLLNQRDMLRQLLSVPKADRLTGEVFKHTIRTAWPELAAFNLNGKPF